MTDDFSIIKRNDRTVVFIDGGHFFSISKSLKFDIDFKKLYNFLHSKANVISINYYRTVFEEQASNKIRLQPLIDYLSYNGYNVHTKHTKLSHSEDSDNYGYQNIMSVSVDIAVDALEISEYIDAVILITGDANISKVVKTLQKKGIKVIVMSTSSRDSHLVSNDLRRSATKFIDLTEYVELLEKFDTEKSVYNEDDN